MFALTFQETSERCHLGLDWQGTVSAAAEMTGHPGSRVLPHRASQHLTDALVRARMGAVPPHIYKARKECIVSETVQI